MAETPLREGANLVSSLPPGERAHRFTLRNDNQGHYHRCMRVTGGPIYVDLYWRESKDSPVRPVALYCLDLRKLLSAGYIRLENEDRPGEVRVRVTKTAYGFSIQASRWGPELQLEVPTIQWGLAEDLED